MRELSLICVGIIMESAVFFSVGSLLMHRMKMKADASLAFVLGYFLYFAVFEVIAVPMTLAWVSLTTAARVWAALLAVSVCCAGFVMGKAWIKQLGKIPLILKEHSFMIILAFFVIFVQCLAVVLYRDVTADAAYYVGTVTTSVHTDTLARYNPYNGVLLKSFQARYIFSAYPMHNAVWCRLVGMHAIVQAKVVMSSINVLTANLLVYQIAKKLFDGNKKQADLMLIFMCVLQLFCGTIYSTGTFFFTRSYEGKALLGNIAIPAVFFCAIWLWQEKDSINVWITLFLVAVSAIAFSGSAIIFPVAITAGMLPVIVIKKHFRALIPYVICMIPSVLYAAAYFGTKLGWLTLRAS